MSVILPAAAHAKLVDHDAHPRVVAPAPHDYDRTFDLRLDDGFGFGPGG